METEVAQSPYDNNIDKAYADSAYDTLSIYSILKHRNIEAIIKPRRNSRYINYKDMNDNVRYIKEQGYKTWSKLKGMVRDGLQKPIYFNHLKRY